MADFSQQLYGDAPTQRDFGAELYGPVEPEREVYEDSIPSPFAIAGNVAAGALRGAGSIGATLIRPFESAEENERRRQQMDEGLGLLGADPESIAYGAGKIGGEIAGTAGAGGVLANLLKRAPAAIARFAPAVESWGMGAPTVAQRVVGGAIPGAAAAGMVDPEQVGIGAGVGAAAPLVLPPVGRAAAWLGGKGYDALTGNLAKVRAGKLTREVAGPDQAAISQAWQSAPADLTAGQAAVDVGRREMSALDALAQRRAPSEYGRISEGQTANDLARLEAVAGSNSAAAAEQSAITGRKAVETALGPEREFLLDVANVGAEAPRMMSQAAEMRKLADEWLRGGDQSKYPMARKLQNQATALEGRAADIVKGGFAPLNVENVSNKIYAMLDDPALGSSENVASVLSDVNRQITQWVGKGEGAIDARALYAKRKTAINETVDKLLAGASPAASKRLSAKLAGEVQSAIDDSLNAATGDKWSGFLSKYSDRLKAIDRQDLVAEARKMYAAKNYKGFMDLVKGEDIDTVRAIMTSEFDIAKALSPNQFAAVTDVGKNITRTENLAEQASKGTDALSRIVGNQLLGIKIPGMISRAATVGNATLAAIESRMNAKTMDIIAKAMQSGKSANDMMKFLPADQREPALMWIANGGLDRYAARMAPATVGQLEP